ncbi:TolC family protein [Myxococcus stipitatus]|uniref:TolC family protein n=1 Tax=Myxococcus stipitatus TaxID=83455 RepID=UPI001F29A478|nr:TolC family protein [Myxococcus stipitatus]MCE9672309.1 TolC family protein [Myxococcus stipitatus]
MSFHEALALARQRAPALLDAAGRVAEAEGAVAGAAPPLRENPTLSAEVGPRSVENGARRGVQYAVGLVQPFELGGRQGARREAARAGLARQTADQRDTERQVLGEVGEAFLRALYAQELTRLMSRTEEAARDLTHATQRRFDAGDVPVVDVNVARVALARAQATVAAARGEEAALLDELRARLGVPTGEPLAVRGELKALAALPVSATTEPRADIVALEAELAQAEAELRLGRSERLPDLSVGIRLEQEVDESALVGTLSLPLPLFSRGQEARVTGAARVNRLRTALEAARRTRDLQVQAATTRDRQRHEALEVLERDALPLLDENESLARKSYEAGEMDLAGLLLVRRETLETRVALLDSHLEAALARVRLAVELGVLP